MSEKTITVDAVALRLLRMAQPMIADCREKLSGKLEGALMTVLDAIDVMEKSCPDCQPEPEKGEGQERRWLIQVCDECDELWSDLPDGHRHSEHYRALPVDIEVVPANPSTPVMEEGEQLQVGQRVEQHGLHPGRGAIVQRCNEGGTVIAIHGTRAEVKFDCWEGTYRVGLDYLRPERTPATPVTKHEVDPGSGVEGSGGLDQDRERGDTVEVVRRDSNRILYAHRLPDGPWYRLDALLPRAGGSEPNVLTTEEATAIVSAALGEDHHAPTLDAVIRRLGDWLDSSVYQASEGD